MERNWSGALVGLNSAVQPERVSHPPCVAFEFLEFPPGELEFDRFVSWPWLHWLIRCSVGRTPGLTGRRNAKRAGDPRAALCWVAGDVDVEVR